jgi:hypothetical protein
MYWPHTGAVSASTFGTNLNVASAAANVKLALTHALGAPPVVANPGIMSQTLGEFHPITQVVIDSKVDTQRGRARGLVAASTGIVNVP